jgi:uncharacterized membrane protein
VWAWPLSTLASLLGIGVAGYLTIVHYTTSVSLACSDTGLINCQKVTTSPQSMVYGAPVALLGLIWFVVMLGLSTPWAWRSPAPWLWIGRLAWVIGGIAMVLHLIYAELFQIDAICLWCSAVHVLTLVLFAIVTIATALARTEPAA